MRFIQNAAATIAFCGVVAVAGTAHAGLSTFDFQGSFVSDTGSTKTFEAADGSQIVARGFVAGLFGPDASQVTHNSGGLGVDWGFFDFNGELDNNFGFEWIVLELPSDNWVPISLMLSNYQAGEDVVVFGSNGDLNDFDELEQIYSGDADNPISFGISASFQAIYIAGGLPSGFFEAIAGQDSFRIATFTGLQQIPEPGSLALLGIGLFGLGAMRRRRLAD